MKRATSDRATVRFNARQLDRSVAEPHEAIRLVWTGDSFEKLIIFEVIMARKSIEKIGKLIMIHYIKCLMIIPSMLIINTSCQKDNNSGMAIMDTIKHSLKITTLIS